MKRRVVFSPEAGTDLFNLYEYIAKQSGAARAIGYIQRIEVHCAGFDFSGERGTSATICGRVSALPDSSDA